MSSNEKQDARNRSRPYRAGMAREEFRAKYGFSAVAKLGSNENPIGPSPRVVDAVRSIAENLHRYPPMSDDVLREALADDTGRGLKAANFLTGNGGADVLSLVAYAILDSASECIICRPTFPVYEMTARRQGANVVCADLDPGDFSYDAGAILDSVTNRTRIVYICNPNNPTGSVCTPGQMDALLDGLPAHVLVVADEVYHHFASDGCEIDSVERVAQGRNVLVIQSFSKARGMAGGRLGYAVGQPETIAAIAAHRLPFHINAVTLAAGLAVLGDDEHLGRTVALVREGRAWIFDQLVKLGVDVWPSEANFLLFRTEFPAAAVLEGLLQRGVIVRSLEGFYLPDHLRVTVGSTLENTLFIDALSDALSTLRKE